MPQDVLVPVSPEQEQRVRIEHSVGSGSPSFKGMREVGGRAFILVLDGPHSRVAGYLPIDRLEEDPTYEGGWKFRVKAEPGRAVWFDTAIPLVADSSNRQWPTKISVEVAEDLIRRGQHP
jgi:hypothetical protein